MAIEPYSGVPGLIAWNSFEGGTTGADVTAANSGGASGTAFSGMLIGGTSTLKYKAAGALADALSMEVIGGGGTGLARWDEEVVGSQTNLYGVAYVYWAAWPTSYTAFIEVKQTNGGVLAYRLKISSSGLLRLTNTLDAAVFSTAASLSLNTKYRIEWHVNSTTGAYEVWWYLGDSTTPVDSRTGTGADFGTAQAQVNFGRAASPDHTTIYDNLGLATSKLGPRKVVGPVGKPVTEVSNTGGWTATGGTSVAVLGDTSDATYISSPDSPTTAKAIRFRLDPLSVTDVVTVTTRDAKNNATQNIERTVTIYDGASNVGSNVFPLSTSITNHQTVTNSQITAGVQLEVVISDVVV